MRYSPANIVKAYPSDKLNTHQDFEELVNIIKEDLEKCEEKNLDFISLIIGGEGTGKSTLSINLALKLDKNFDIRKDVILFPREMDARICKRLLLDAKKRRKLKTIVIDEGAAYYNKFRQTSHEGYNVFLDLVIGREYKFHYIWNVQNPADVGLVIREGRFNRVLYTFYDNNLNRYVALIKKRVLETKLIHLFEKPIMRKAVRKPYSFLNKVLKVGDYLIFRFPDLDKKNKEIYLKIKQLNLLTVKFIRVWRLNEDDLFYIDLLASMLLRGEVIFRFGIDLPEHVYNKFVELSKKTLKIGWLIREFDIEKFDCEFKMQPIQPIKFPKLFVESLIKIYNLRKELGMYGIRED